MKCPTCGKRVLSSDRSCKHCGKRLPRSKKGAKPKYPLLQHVLTDKRLAVGAVGVFILIACVLIILPGEGTRETGARRGYSGEEITIERGKTDRELASNAVLGTVLATHIRETRGGTLMVQSLHTGKVYAFSVGWYTSYHPQRYPSLGERVKVYHLNNEGHMKATQVTLEQ